MNDRHGGVRGLRRAVLAEWVVVVVLAAGAVSPAVAQAREAPPEAALQNVIEVTGGIAHTCALMSDRTVRCWGRGAQGRLGNGSTADHHTPVTVLNPAGTGPLSGIDDIDAGGNHTCALQNGEAGAVFCWGDNTAGKLGDGTTHDRLRPVRVRDEAGPGFLAPTQVFSFLSAGLDQTCVSSFTLWCWGRNDFGQLGDGTTTDRHRPVRVRDQSGPGYVDHTEEVSTGNDHTCARVGSYAYCWGKNQDGQLGDGTRTRRLRPTPVRRADGSRFRVNYATAGGEHTCAEPVDENVIYCWGDNTFGQVGDGTTTDRLRPVVVRGPTGPGALTGLWHVAAGGSHNCAVYMTDELRCWGLGSSIQLGNGSAANRSRPVPVSDLTDTGALTGADALGSGRAHSCARYGHEVVCWGENASGQIGDGTTAVHNVPVLVHE